MTFSRLRFREVISGGEIFRVASLLLYITLLLHVSLMAYLRHLRPEAASIAAVALLAVLLALALARLLGPFETAYGSRRVLPELLGAVVVISLLTLQRSMPVLPLIWLVGAAGVFPLVLSASAAIWATLGIALTGFVLNLQLGMALQASLPIVFIALFVGMLSILLATAFNRNLSTIQHALINQRRFDTIARATRHVIIITDVDSKVKYANPAVLDVLGYTPADLERGAAQTITHPDDVGSRREKLERLRKEPGSSMFSRHRTCGKDGVWIWIEERGYNMLHDEAIAGLVFTIEDITSRIDTERKLMEEHTLLRAVLELNPSMIYAKDVEGRFTISNSSFQHRRGYSSEEELRGKTAYEVFQMQAADGKALDTYETADKLHRQDMQVMKSGIALEDQEIQGLREGDNGRWYRTSKYPLRDASGATTGVLGITRDVTDHKQYEIRLQHQAMHDTLTGLPNRRYLLKTIAERTHGPRGHDVSTAILFCDLDFFKSVNDTHGHEVGDKCLIEITSRIRAEMPFPDFVARFGGDEFVILTEATLAQAEAKAGALLQTLSRPLVVGDVVVKIHASIGIALLTPEHRSPLDLLRDADAAMYQAKERGRNRAEVFDASLQHRVTKRAQMDVALRFALERNELAPVYQPKVAMTDGTLRGFEVLLRWNSPQYGDISPTEFIPIAESSGLVVPIGMWALEQGCRQLKLWQERYPNAENLTIAVNVSMRQLMQASFLRDVSAMLENTGVSPRSIELELTETSAMANPQQSIETLSLLKGLGLRLALDDFGTGYSSLAYLQKLPIDVIKIDKAFVPGLVGNRGDGEIIRLILALAHALDLETVAEGVESFDQVKELRDLGCHIAQGYVFSPALSAADAESLLRERKQFALS
ncbi:MAG: hypothetical protein JWQ23_615 [Herminiimonas sp.]|nr:hypothetical protein [Herminiimonas sp.]